MRRRRIGLLAATSAATMALSVPSAFGASNDEGRRGGATMEEFVCFRTTGDQTRIGTGRVIRTPSGNVHVVCTGKPPRPVDPDPEPAG